MVPLYFEVAERDLFRLNNIIFKIVSIVGDI